MGDLFKTTRHYRPIFMSKHNAVSVSALFKTFLLARGSHELVMNQHPPTCGHLRHLYEHAASERTLEPHLKGVMGCFRLGSGRLLQIWWTRSAYASPKNVNETHSSLFLMETMLDLEDKEVEKNGVPQYPWRGKKASQHVVGCNSSVEIEREECVGLSVHWEFLIMFLVWVPGATCSFLLTMTRRRIS